MSAETEKKQGRSAAEIIQQINVKNAKLLALVLVVGFVLYHGMLHLRYGKIQLNNYNEHNLNI